MNKISLTLSLVPACIIALLSIVLLVAPDSSYMIISEIRYILGDRFSSYYLMIGLAFVIIILYLSFSKYGNVRLGTKRRFNNFQWGAMIFTSTMAADILYFALHEWAYYFNANPHNLQQYGAYESQLWSSTYPLFHWGPIPWGFYILPAVAYAYMKYARGFNVYRLSGACGIRNRRLGTIIDIFAIVALLVATSTTFSLATPLITESICGMVGISESSVQMTISVLLAIAFSYTVAALFDLKGVSHLASSCVITFGILLLTILFNSDVQYTIETGITGVGSMFQNFFALATDTGSLRLVSDSGNTFVQDWTVFYWAYWISWSIATPFFIARISEGRTIRQTALGAMIAGLLGTFTAFIILGNYGLHAQLSGSYDMVSAVANSSAPEAIVSMLMNTTSHPKVVLALLAISMIIFYASTFDALTLVVSQYVCRRYTETPPKILKFSWSLVFIMLPIALIFTESTLYSLQALNIIFAFPVSLILIRIVYVFSKSLRDYAKIHRL